MSPKSSLDLLAIGAHPDDVELSCGGLLASLSEKGRSVAVADLTEGELGSQGTVDLRRQEAKAAGEILGLVRRENMAFPDAGITDGSATGDEGCNPQLEKAVALIRRLKPKMLAIPYWKSRHPDHAATGELFTRALFYSGVAKFAPRAGEKHSVPQVIYYQMRLSFQPSFIVDITHSHEKKMQSIRAYHSQVTREDGSDTLVSSPLSLDSVVARDAYFGSMIGVPYGEAYLTRNAIGVKDPMELFSEYPGKNSLFLREEQ